MSSNAEVPGHDGQVVSPLGLDHDGQEVSPLKLGHDGQAVSPLELGHNGQAVSPLELATLTWKCYCALLPAPSIVLRKQPWD